MRKLWHSWDRDIHLEWLQRARFDIPKMFTPPKEKDPWTAMTKGSTGGWAAPFAKPAALLPAAAALAALPVTGGLSGAFIPQLAALGATGAAVGGLQGATTGIWGKPGTGLSIFKGAGMGAGQGAGVSGIAQLMGSLAPATQSAYPSFSSALNQASTQPFYTGVPGGTFGTGVGGAGTTGAGSGMSSFFGSLAKGAQSAVSSLVPSIMGAGGQGGYNADEYEYINGERPESEFNLSNVMKYVMGGAQALMPTPKTSPDIMKGAVQSPNLVEARDMIRDLAIMKPDELLGPASDEYIQASLRQSRAAADRQKQYLINEYSKRGKVLGKSGGLDSAISNYDREQVQREQDYITAINESRQVAAIAQKIKLVQEYYNISEKEAADMLEAEKYISPQDSLNYISAISKLRQAQALFG